MVMSVDTLRVDHRGCCGHRLKTPDTDALAVVGSCLARAYGRVLVTPWGHRPPLPANPMCCHSHDSNKLNPALPTLASVLQAQG